MMSAIKLNSGPFLISQFLQLKCLTDMLTAFLIGFLVYDWGVKTNAKMHRKNPLDYEDDE